MVCLLMLFVTRYGVANELPVSSVEAVDLLRYAGRWYEVAHFPMFFQRKCIGDTTAEYSLQPSGTIKVVNRCRTAEGFDEAEGKATAVAGSKNARLKVSFFWPFSADYWIFGLDPEYRWAVVGNPNRKYLWILSRMPRLSPELLSAALASARQRGFDLAQLRYTRHGDTSDVPPTPPQMLGPYYPLQPDTAAGNDLTAREGSGRALGEPLEVSGKVSDTHGQPLAGILVEIWQTNHHGRYHHPHDTTPQPVDPNFRGYGQVLTDDTGRYRFKTIRPVSYPGRTPHIHFRLSRSAQELLVTQMYLPDEPRNRSDGLFMSIPDAEMRARLMGQPEVGKAGALRFDLVVDPRQ